MALSSFQQMQDEERRRRQANSADAPGPSGAAGAMTYTQSRQATFNRDPAGFQSDLRARRDADLARAGMERRGGDVVPMTTGGLAAAQADPMAGSGGSQARPPAELRPMVPVDPAPAPGPMEGELLPPERGTITGDMLRGLRGSTAGALTDAQARQQNPALFQEMLPSGHGAGMTMAYLRAAELQRGNRLREARNQMLDRMGGLASLRAQGSPALAAIDQRIMNSDAQYGGMVTDQQGRVMERQGLASQEGIAALQDDTTRRGQDIAMQSAMLKAQSEGGGDPGIFRQELDRQGARNLIDLRESAQQTAATIGQLESMQELLRDNTTGFYRDKIGQLDNLLGGALGVRNPRQAFQAFSNFLTAQTAQNILTGVLTQKDMELFQQAMPSFDKPNEVNAYLVDFYTRAMQNGINRVNAMEEYAAQNGTLEGFDDSRFRNLSLDVEALTDPARAMELVQSGGSPPQQERQPGGMAAARPQPPAPQFNRQQIAARAERLAQQGVPDWQIRQQLIDEGIDLEAL